MRNKLIMRTAAPAVACIVAFLAVCGQRAFGYNRMGNDRILLMNDDRMLFRAVTGQAYTNTSLAVGQDGFFWEHSGSYSFGSTDAAFALLQGTNHVYRSVRDGVTNTLWTISNASAGSVLRADSGWNFVPASSSAIPTINEWETCVTNKKTGKITISKHAVTNINCEVVMLNIEGASVTSPFYAEGIGAIYFDAVNSSASEVGQSLELQIATNSVEGTQITEATALSECVWEPVPVDVFLVENKSALSKVEREDNRVIPLAANIDMGNQFFRVRKSMQYFGPIRFRIVRVTANTQHSVGTFADFIDIDNIIASYPVKTIELHEYGTYDDTREGVAVRGWTPAFSSAFPAVGEEGVKGRVTLEYFGDFTIPRDYGVTKDLAVNKVTMKYRWRYLDQITNAWQTLEMRKIDADGVEWETIDELDLSDGIGDIEYSFAAEIYSPAYHHTDYTGCDVLGYPADWDEEITSVERVADAEESFSKSIDKISPAGGKDFFVRLREGVSQYELVQLVNTVTGLVEVVTNQEDVAEWGSEPLTELQPFTTVLTNSLELVGDHLWRGYMKTPTNHAEYADFHFLGLNLTENGANALSGNATHWKPAEAVIPAESLPYSGLVEVTEEPQDSKVALDAAQEYLMFDFNDQFGTFTITHADYQNFNIWTDAKGQVFVGDASSGTTGVSRVKTAYTEAFTNMTIKTSESLSTNKFWTEKFNAGNEANIQAAWQRKKHFTSKLSPNGWTCENGEWASEKYITNNLAFRMDGCGYGSISLQNLTEPMNGVDTFTFKARLSQYLGFDSFSYNETKTTDKNYGIMAGAAISTNSGNDMSPETPTMSMVAYYRPNEGCYEFRATRYDEYVVKLEIYKWAKSGYAVVTNCLVSTNITLEAFANDKTKAKSWLQDAAALQLYGMYMWVTNDVAAPYTARICAGIARQKESVKNNHPFFGYSATDLDPANNKFFRLECSDSNNPLRRGAYGVGANDCRARFNGISRNDMTHGFSPEASMSTYELSEFDDGNWTPAIGRAEIYSAHTAQEFGITTMVTPQPVTILFAAAPEGATTPSNIEWTDKIGYTVSPSSEVSDFQNKTFTVTVHSTSNYFPRLQHGASGFDPRTDITVDDLEIKGYRGVPATEWTSSSLYQWVWTEAWVSKKSNTQLACNFWPDRANPSYPLSLRSPLLDGLSMLSFRYENAQPGVKLLVQIWTNGIEYASSDLVRMTRAVSDPDWVTVDTFTVNAGDPQSGSPTTYLSLRAPVKGLVRPSVTLKLQPSPEALKQPPISTSASSFSPVLPE